MNSSHVDSNRSTQTSQEQIQAARCLGFELNRWAFHTEASRWTTGNFRHSLQAQVHLQRLGQHTRLLLAPNTNPYAELERIFGSTYASDMENASPRHYAQLSLDICEGIWSDIEEANRNLDPEELEEIRLEVGKNVADWIRQKIGDVISKLWDFRSSIEDGLSIAGISCPIPIWQHLEEPASQRSGELIQAAPSFDSWGLPRPQPPERPMWPFWPIRRADSTMYPTYLYFQPSAGWQGPEESSSYIVQGNSAQAPITDTDFQRTPESTPLPHVVDAGYLGLSFLFECGDHFLIRVINGEEVRSNPLTAGERKFLFPFTQLVDGVAPGELRTYEHIDSNWQSTYGTRRRRGGPIDGRCHDLKSKIDAKIVTLGIDLHNVRDEGYELIELRASSALGSRSEH